MPVLSGNPLLRQKAAAFRQLATMLSAGMTIAEALSILGKRTQDVRLKAFFARAAKDTGAGRRLSDLLAEEPKLFPPLTLALVQAAEHSGRIEEIFKRLADYYEQEYQVRLMLSRETFYPKLLIAAIILIPIFAQTIIKFVTEGTGAAMVELIKSLGLVVLVLAVVLGALYAAWRAIAKSEAGRASLDGMKLHIPLIGKVVRRAAMARFARALGTLFGAGVSMDKSCELAGEATANAQLRQMVHGAGAQVRGGKGLGDALVEAGMADDMVLAMVRTGEQTGNLEETLTHVAEYYEDEAATATRQMAVAIIPIVVIIAGVVVGFMLVRFYTGLYGGLVGQ